MRLALEEKALKYKGVEIAILAREQLEPWYARIHPLMTVPSLVIDTGAKLIDSEAIIGYLDQITPECKFLIKFHKLFRAQFHSAAYQ